MAEFFDYYKVTMDYLKGNKWLVLLMFGGLGSVGTNISQYFVGQEDDFLKGAMKDQITIMAGVTPKPVKSGCGQCAIFIQEHKKGDH